MIHPETSPALSAASKGIYNGNNSHVLELINLEAGYGDAPVFSFILFSCAQFACRRILGPNGSGKSTALKAIAGLLPLEKGFIRLNGIEVHGQPVLGRPHGMSIVLQSSVSSVSLA